MDQIQVVFEDKNEQFGYTPIPNVVLTSTVLSPTEVRIYGILRRYASLPKGAKPSVPTICMEANISKATYNRAIRRFIRSTENPNPEIPLITAIHRKNKTNVFKIHVITDELIEKLKPAMLLEKEEQEAIKAKYKRRKSTSQNETPSENTRESQNETHLGSLNMRRTPVSICDTNNKENEIDDDGSAKVPQPWESDSLYLAFRQLFISAGGKDIVKHAEHYKKFRQLVEQIGYGSLVSRAEQYIKAVQAGLHEHHNRGVQIVWFLSDGWQNFGQGEKPAKQRKQPKAEPRRRARYVDDDFMATLGVQGGQGA